MNAFGLIFYHTAAPLELGKQVPEARQYDRYMIQEYFLSAVGTTEFLNAIALKAAAKAGVPGMKGVVDDLSARFPGRSAAAPNTNEAKK